MRVIVFGSKGFIGRATRKALRQAGHELSTTVCTLDEKPQAAINCAWHGLPDYSVEACLENLVSQKLIYQWLGRFDSLIRIVGVGTHFEIEPHPGTEAFVETKIKIKELGFRMFTGRFVWARPAFVYGRGQRGTSLFPSIYSALVNGREPVLKSPEAEHDFIHVEDVAAGLVRLIDPAVPCGEYELKTGTVTKVKDAAALMRSMVSPRSVTPPGWKPKHDLRSGIHQTLTEWGA